MSPVSRKIVSLKAELHVEEASFTGNIESFTMDGIYVLTTSLPSTEISCDAKLEVRIQTNASKVLAFQGRLIGSSKTPPYGITDSMYIQVLDSSRAYEELYLDL